MKTLISLLQLLAVLLMTVSLMLSCIWTWHIISPYSLHWVDQSTLDTYPLTAVALALSGVATRVLANLLSRSR